MASQKEQAYNEVLQIAARYAKNDKSLMTKLRELKMKYSEGGLGFNSSNTLITNQNALTVATCPDEPLNGENHSQTALNVL